MQKEPNCTIALAVYNDKGYWAMARSMLSGCPHIEAADLMQEISVVLLEYDNDKLNEKRNSHYFRFFIMRIMRNMVTNPKKAFRKGLDLIGEEYTDSHSAAEVHALQDFAPLVEQIVSGISEKSEIEKQIFLAYVRHGGIRAASRALDVDHLVVYRAVKEVKTYVNNKLKEII